MFRKSTIAFLLAATLRLGAQVAPPADDAAAAAAAASLSAYEKGDHSAERIAMLLPQLADPARRNAVRTRLLDQLPVPALLTLLKHPSLAVRLGALELLEERAGGDFDFNPWNAPELAENVGPLARWAQWAAASDPSKKVSASALLGDDQRRGYLRDLLAQDDDKASRARHMLETDGLGSVAFLEDFLRGSPALAPGIRARIRQAQYQIVLAPKLGPGSSETARNLAFGSRDQLLAALASTKGAGHLGLPILRDFIDHADPLVRETAIDAILVTGGADALPWVGPVLAKEPDVNVIHGAMRRLKEVPGEASEKLAASFLTHPDEDLLVSAIQTCQKLGGGEDGSRNPFSRSSSKAGKGKSSEPLIIAALSDPRWRVRVAALEYIDGRKVAKASDTVLRLLDDPDEFVRFAAIKTACALKLKSALPKLKAIFMANDAMAGPVLEGYGALDATPDAAMLEHLAKANPEARIAAVRAAESTRSLADLVIRFASDPDTDVACAALRFLSADEDRVASNPIASLLVAAMRSGSAEKRAAVLDALILPVSKTVDPAVMRMLENTQLRPETTELDPLYDGFLKPLQVAATDDRPAPLAQIPGAQGALIAELIKLTHENVAPDLQYAAALALARAGQPAGMICLVRLLPTLSTARKAAIAEGLGEPSHRETLPLLQALMRDPVGEIRAAAASRALANDDAPAFTQILLDELDRTDTPLHAHETYSSSFESIARSEACGAVLRAWALKTLRNDKSSESRKILACVALGNQSPAAAAPLLVNLIKASPSAWLRRAAARTLGCARPADWKLWVDAVSRDPSPFVREVVPAVANRKFKTWTHHFDDVHSDQDSSYYSGRSSRRSSQSDQVVLAALERLAAESEVSATVRFDALFALMTQGKTVDVHAMVQLLGKQAEDDRVPYHIAQWFEDAAKQVGPGLRPLFAVIDTKSISEDKLALIVKRLNPDGSNEKAPMSFAALGSRAPDSGATQQVTVLPETAVKIRRDTLPLIFFFKPGCRECNATREMLKTLKRDYATLAIEEHNMLEADAVVLNEALCARFRVPSPKHHIAPSIFTQSGYLVREDINPPALATLLAKTAATDQDDAWKSIDQPQIEVAKEQVTQRYHALTLPVVIGAGLLDGVNPCAFATIIFFLSYLQIARRTRREMLVTGIAFIIGVFLAYLAAGLLFYQALAALHQRFAGIQNWLNPIFAAFALFAAILSFRDALRARHGRINEMTLQLPAFLKDRIRGVIRSGARARRFVIAAFLTGVAISFLELACTGQVYAPIVYQIQQGQLDAVAMLVLYNLAFVAPLVAIFLLAYGGLRSESLIDLQKKHTFAVKIALGLLFVLLAVFILLGDRILHS